MQGALHLGLPTVAGWVPPLASALCSEMIAGPASIASGTALMGSDRSVLPLLRVGNNVLSCLLECCSSLSGTLSLLSTFVSGTLSALSTFVLTPFKCEDTRVTEKRFLLT